MLSLTNGMESNAMMTNSYRVSTYKLLLEVVRVDKSILGAEEDVLYELLVRKGGDVVVGEDGVTSYKVWINSTRVDPLGFGPSPTATYEVLT